MVLLLLKGIGVVPPASSLFLSSVLYIHSFPLSLLSVSKTSRSLNCVGAFYSQFCVFQDLKTQKTWLKNRSILVGPPDTSWCQRVLVRNPDSKKVRFFGLKLRCLVFVKHEKRCGFALFTISQHQLRERERDYFLKAMFHSAKVSGKK